MGEPLGGSRVRHGRWPPTPTFCPPRSAPDTSPYRLSVVSCQNVNFIWVSRLAGRPEATPGSGGLVTVSMAITAYPCFWLVAAKLQVTRVVWRLHVKLSGRSVSEWATILPLTPVRVRVPRQDRPRRALRRVFQCVGPGGTTSLSLRTRSCHRADPFCVIIT